MRLSAPGERGPGLRAARVLTVDLDLPFSRYGDLKQAGPFYRRLLDGLDGLPGVDSAAMINQLPFSGSSMATGVSLASVDVAPGAEELRADLRG